MNYTTTIKLKQVLALIVINLNLFLFAQTPEGINYQAVIRKTNGTLVTNTTVAVRIQIKQNSATGTVVYSERQSVITSAYGLVNFVIGQGTLLSGTFSTINWSTGNYWVSLGVDFTNGTNYLDYGSQRLMSAPYALYAKTAGVQLNQWRYGATAPAAALGNIGDFYLNTATGDVHYKSAASTWTLTGNIKGPQGNAGATGAAGPQGPAGATGLQGPAGVAGATGLTGATGPQGPAGATGLTGATGPQGPAGATGPSGTNGNGVLNGNVVPTNVQGNDGDFYINTITNTIYGPKANGIWPSGVSLVGPQGPAGGPAGPQGIAGTNGNSVLNGTVNPNLAIGVDGDFYINTLTNEIFGPKSAGVWPQGISLVGPSGLAGAPGPQGPAGAMGPQGVIGANGTSVLNGNINPVAGIGMNGDFYINTTTNELFGPKANGAWPQGISLVGPSGANGLQGPAGPQGPQGPTGPAGGGMTVNCGTAFNSNYTIRGDGSGTYECTNALVITSTGKVGIGNTSPSSSFDLNVGSGGFLVDGSSTTSNIAGKLRIGSTSSSTYDLTVDGHAYLTSGVRVGTTTTPATGGILANGVIESNTRFIQGSSTSGTGTVMIRTSGGELRPQSSTKFVKDNIVDLKFSKDQIFKLRPVMYNLKPALGGDREIGLIAEEVEEALPELVIYGPERQWIGNTGIPQTDENGKEILNTNKLVPYSVYYDRLPVYLLSIIKEQEERLNQLEKKIANLEAEK
jgi:hypothetical protein